jgi:integrase
MESVLLDVAGHRRSPATMPGYHRGRAPRNKGEQYPADPPTVEEIVAVMRSVSDRSDGHRLRALIVLLWRAGLRISKALALQESDLDRSRGAVLVRRGLCRIRHKQSSAGACVMPSRPSAAHVLPA